MEGKATDETIGDFDEALQEGTDGGNRYTYWVTRAAGREWKQLPPVTQAQICVARKVRRGYFGYVPFSRFFRIRYIWRCRSDFYGKHRVWFQYHVIGESG